MVHRRPCHELCKLFAQTPTRVHVPQLGGVSRNVRGSPPRAWKGLFWVLREKKILVYGVQQQTTTAGQGSRGSYTRPL